MCSLLILLVFLLRHSYGWSLIQSQNIYLIEHNRLHLEFLTLIYDIEDQSYKKTVLISYFSSIVISILLNQAAASESKILN